MTDAEILVTGATGFIGSALFKRLRAEGYKVDGLSLNGGQVDGETVSSVDVESEKALEDYTKNKTYRAIFHIAACLPRANVPHEFEKCFNPNVLSVKNILKLSATMGECHLVYASSATVYGRNLDIPLTESSACLPDNFYALSKYVGELLCGLYEQSFPITILRIPSPYGPGYSRQTVINIFCRQALVSGDLKIYGSGGRRQDFIYIDDIVEAFVLSLKSRSAGVFNICSGKSLNMLELARLVISLVPSSGSKIVTSGQPDPQEDFMAAYSKEKASKTFGFSPHVLIAEGLAKTISWWRGQ